MTPDTAPYWQGLKEGKLLLQRCTACGHLRHYPQPICPACFSPDHDWQEAAGTATVESWTETHHPFLPNQEVPVTLVTATLDEGPRLLAPLRGPTDALARGATVEIGVETHGDSPIPVVALASPPPPGRGSG